MSRDWFIVVATRESDYGEEGRYDYDELAGVIGPFPTKDAALQEDRERFWRDACYETEVVQLTSPGGSVIETKYNPEPEVQPAPKLEPETFERGGWTVHGGAMSAVERAGDVIDVDLTDLGVEILPGQAKSAAQALADAGLLLTDEDRAVLDAAEAETAIYDDLNSGLMGDGRRKTLLDELYEAQAATRLAVRARREATS